jgi:hypothetical protein
MWSQYQGQALPVGTREEIEDLFPGEASVRVAVEPAEERRRGIRERSAGCDLGRALPPDRLAQVARREDAVAVPVEAVEVGCGTGELRPLDVAVLVGIEALEHPAPAVPLSGGAEPAGAGIERLVLQDRHGHFCPLRGVRPGPLEGLAERSREPRLERTGEEGPRLLRRSRIGGAGRGVGRPGDGQGRGKEEPS